MDSIAKRLGKLRRKLIKQGFNEDQAFQIVQDLVRREKSDVSILAE